MNNKNNPFYLRFEILIPAIFSLLIISFGFSLSFLTMEKEIDTNNISNAIQFCSLIIGIVTILFVLKTYQSQKEQIAIQQKELAENKKDGEYNRLLDITFRQLEFSMRNLEFSLEEQRVFNQIKDFPEIPSEYLLDNSEYIIDIFSRLDGELTIHMDNILKSSLAEDKMYHLLNLVDKNIYAKFAPFIENIEREARDIFIFSWSNAIVNLDLFQSFKEAILNLFLEIHNTDN